MYTTVFSRCQTGLCQSPTLYFILVKPCSLEGCWVWFVEGSQSSGASNRPIKNWSSKTVLATFNCLVDYYGAVLVFTLLNQSFLFSSVLLPCSCIWKAPQRALRLPQHWLHQKDFREGPCVAVVGSRSINRLPCLWCTWHCKPIKGSLCRLLWRLEALAFTVDWFLWIQVSHM